MHLTAGWAVLLLAPGTAAFLCGKHCWLTNRQESSSQQRCPVSRSTSTPRHNESTMSSSSSSSSCSPTTAEDFRKRRNPSFPRKAYSLYKDEQALKHNYISFIDQSIFSEYSQTVRLVEPRMYARPEQFARQNLARPPTVEDVAEPASCKLYINIYMCVCVYYNFV